MISSTTLLVRANLFLSVSTSGSDFLSASVIALNFSSSSSTVKSSMEKGTLGAFVLEYKGNEVKVGSGFTDEQREKFWQKRDGLTGTLCEVKYKEISQDKGTGLESLQFPVFVGLRTDKTEVSYG